jgi:hypothetical protein
MCDAAIYPNGEEVARKRFSPFQFPFKKRFLKCTPCNSFFVQYKNTCPIVKTHSGVRLWLAFEKSALHNGIEMLLRKIRFDNRERMFNSFKFFIE